MKSMDFWKLSVLLMSAALLLTACGKKDVKSISDESGEKVEPKINLNKNNNAPTDFIYDLDKTGTGIIILRYAGGVGTVTIPEKIEGYPVIEIRNEAFSAGDDENSDSIRNNIISITVPDTVTRIGFEAFAGMKKLQTVTLPKGLVFLSPAMFENCTALTSMKLPEGLKDIGPEAFSGCSSLANVKFPESLELIMESAFYNCDALPKSLELPSAIKEIEKQAFANCNSINSVKLPETITSIGEAAFFGCSELNTINIPVSLTKFGNAAFGMCEKLTLATRKDIRDKGYDETKSIESVSGYGYYRTRHITAGTFLGKYEQ